MSKQVKFQTEHLEQRTRKETEEALEEFQDYHFTIAAWYSDGFEFKVGDEDEFEEAVRDLRSIKVAEKDIQKQIRRTADVIADIEKLMKKARKVLEEAEEEGLTEARQKELEKISAHATKLVDRAYGESIETLKGFERLGFKVVK
jgi:hypothetical protein